MTISNADRTDDRTALTSVVGFSDAGSGYDWLAGLPAMFQPLASWGRSGWSLGDWPCVAYAWGRLGGGDWIVTEYVEGDTRTVSGPFLAVCHWIDEQARYWWDTLENGPDEITPDVLGPYAAALRADYQPADA